MLNIRILIFYLYNLFRGCGRWPDFTEGYASFNHSCTTPQEIKQYLNIEPYKSQYEIDNKIR